MNFTQELRHSIKDTPSVSFVMEYQASHPSAHGAVIYLSIEEIVEKFNVIVLKKSSFTTFEEKTEVDFVFGRIDSVGKSWYITIRTDYELSEPNYVGTVSGTHEGFESSILGIEIPNDTFKDNKNKAIIRCDCEFYYNTKYALQEIEQQIKDYIKVPPVPKEGGYANIILQHGNSLGLREFEVQPTVIDISLNYGEGFKELYDYSLGKLTDKSATKGLYLFHGKPGTGKTSIIRHLITEICRDKTVIYIPPDFATTITDPGFLSFLMQYEGCVLIIEDAENILRSRKQGQSQAAANILNLTDGLLADLLKIQIICTFNCELGEIDAALLRKGRLTARHEFKELDLDQTQKVIDSLGLNHKASKPMTLADIYNLSERDYVNPSEMKKIGFKN